MDFKTNHKGPIASEMDSPPPPPPPYSSIAGSQTLDVHYASWTSHIIITDGTGQELFTSHAPSCSRTRLEIFDRHRRPIGRSKSSNFSSKIDVEMNDGGGLFEMHNSRGILGGSPKYTSPAFNGSEMVWRNKAMSRKIVYELLVDGTGAALAKFHSDPKTKVGRFEIVDGVGGEERVNEVVVTLLTLLHRKLRNIQDATIAAII